MITMFIGFAAGWYAHRRKDDIDKAIGDAVAYFKNLTSA